MEVLDVKFAQMNSAISDFVKEMKFQNLWDNVVLLTASDFGRTITPNSAGGTDHGLLFESDILMFGCHRRSTSGMEGHGLCRIIALILMCF